MSREHPVLAAAPSRAAIVLLVAAGLGGCAANRSDHMSAECKCAGDKVQVFVSEVNGKPDVVPDSAKAREGDEVHWIFRGGGAKEFAILFSSVADSPFDWSQMKGAQVKACVKAGAARNGPTTEYNYNVDIDGQVLDPKIIIEK
jgi:hypothetical protein